MSDAATSSEFTPERARRYVAEVMPQLLARAAANLGIEDGEGISHPEPDAHAARVALLSAEEVLEYLGVKVGDEVVLPLRATLDRLEHLFQAQHPDLPLEMPRASTSELPG